MRAIVLSGLMLLSASSFASSIDKASADDCNLKSMCAEIAAKPYVAKVFPADPNKIAARLNEVEIQVRTRLPSALAKGRTMDQLTREERSTLAAMASTRIVTLAEDSRCQRICDITYMGYSSEFERVCICPSALAFDDEFLIWSVAHEVAHIGGICSFVRTSLRPGQHPFVATAAGESVVQCLEAIGMSNRRTLRNVPAPKNLPWLKWLTGEIGETQMDDEERCFARDLTMNEATADVIGFEVLGDYAKDHPLEPGAETFRRMFGLFAESGCRYNSPDDRARQQRLGHPAHLDRIEKTALSLPSIRRALGCKPETPAHNCEYQPAAMKKSASDTRGVR